MLTISAYNAEDFYLKANETLFTIEAAPCIYYRGYQKLHLNFIGYLSQLGKLPWDLSDMGYTKTKLNNLIKFYSSVQEIEKYKRELKKAQGKDQASIYFSTVGEYKGDNKKDHCIRGIGVNLIKGEIVNAHIFYRSSELSRKFLADLIFFSSYLFPLLEIKNDVPITIHFTCCYVHAKQFPMFAVLDQYLEFIEFEDKKMEAMVFKNLRDITTNDKEGFGLVKTTNKIFRSRYKQDKELKKIIDKIITK